MKITIAVMLDGNELQRDYVIRDASDGGQLGDILQDMIISLERYNNEPMKF